MLQNHLGTQIAHMIVVHWFQIQFNLTFVWVCLKRWHLSKFRRDHRRTWFIRVLIRLKKKGLNIIYVMLPTSYWSHDIHTPYNKKFQNKLTFDITQDGKKHWQKKHQKKDNNEKIILALQSSVVNYIHDSIWWWKDHTHNFASKFYKSFFATLSLPIVIARNDNGYSKIITRSDNKSGLWFVGEETIGHEDGWWLDWI